MSSMSMKLYAPRMLWWMPERPKVWVVGFQSKKYSLLSGYRLSPLTYSFHVSHSSSRRYMSGVMYCDG